MKKKGKSLSLLVLIVAVIGFFAFAGFKGFVLLGYEFKPFDKVITRGLDLQGGVSVLMEIQEDEVTQDQLESTKKHLELRVNKLGVAETVVTTEGNKRIRVDVPGAYDSNDIVQNLSQSGNLEFKDPDGNVLLTGSDVKKASAQFNQETGKYEVSLEFTDEGTTKFAEATASLVGKQISIYLDNEMVSSPTVQTTINDGRASITGQSTLEANKSLAATINAGALPVAVKVASVKNVGAELGVTAFPNAMKAGAIGVGLVFLFMIAIYRRQGLFADIALTLYIVLALLIFVEVGVTLTLPGIAAFLLTIGMAVDANILIFERTKEELRKGISVKSAIKRGSENALSSIVDSNVTTILCALILYFIGSGSVKGFAITLMIGILVSLFTALVVTKILINLAVDCGFLGKPAHFGVKKDKPVRFSKLKIIENSKIFISISLLIILVGVGFTCFKGLNFGIDFKGGTQVSIQLNDEITKDEADAIVDKYVENAHTTLSDSNEYEIKAINFDSEQVSNVMKDLEEQYSLEESALLSQDEIGAAVGSELTKNSLGALFAAFVVMLIYIAIRFEFKFGIAALIATFHDILITVSMYAIFGISVNTPFIAAILTVVGYSMNDTIVIFDRIRENSKKMRRADSTEVANVSIDETLSRSIYTSLSTLVTIVAINILVPSVREFTMPLIVGVVAGAYSSICIASPIWVILKEKMGNKKRKVQKA